MSLSDQLRRIGGDSCQPSAKVPCPLGPVGGGGRWSRLGWALAVGRR